MNDNFRDNYDLPSFFFSSASKKWSFCSFVCCCRESRKNVCALVMIDEICSNEEDQDLVDPESKCSSGTHLISAFEKRGCIICLHRSHLIWLYAICLPAVSLFKHIR